MTNYTREATDQERVLPCCVHHPDAGGQCGELASKVVYGLNFCAAHGAEVEAGALMGAYLEAADFFERLRNPYVPTLPGVIDGELAALVGRYTHTAWSDAVYHEALKRGYPETPERVRDQVDNWKRDEAPGLHTVEDVLLDALRTVHDCQRVAYERGETWLVEALEAEREGVAAQTAYAMRKLSPSS